MGCERERVEERGLTGEGIGAGAARAARERERMRRAEESLKPNMRRKMMLLGGLGWMGGSYLYGVERNGSVYERCEHDSKWAAVQPMHPNECDPNINAPSFPFKISLSFSISRLHQTSTLDTE